MLLSLLAGGVGLNLVGGNHLFILDPHWNPQLEEQAGDRIYRVGQRRDVFIHRSVAGGGHRIYGVGQLGDVFIHWSVAGGGHRIYRVGQRRDSFIHRGGGLTAWRSLELGTC